MRLADEHDLMTSQERERYHWLTYHSSQLKQTAKKVEWARRRLNTACPAAVPSLERAEAQIVAAVEEIRRDLALLMGDET